LDLTKPPAPVLRWLGILVIGIVYAAQGAPKRLSDWLWATIFAGALILPDVAGFGIGGMRLDLKHAREELATLRQDVNAQARSTASSSLGFKALYHQRGAVEREFGRLKHERGMLPLRVRRLPRVRLHVDLTILAKLATALAATRT